MSSNQSSPQCLLAASRLWRYYDEHAAVRGLDIELQRGDVLGFLGPNGAGKSTTLQMLSGNLAPSSGSIVIDGVDLLEQPSLAKRSLGYLPETPPLYPDMSTVEFLEFCARLHGIPATERDGAIERTIERCGLGDMRRRLIGNLSKGFRQRVGIAQAVLHDPAVILLDEPTVGLDPIQIRDIRKLVRDLAAEHAIILSTHLLPEVQEICSRVLIINHGEAVYEDTLAGIAEGGAAAEFRISGSALPDAATLEAIEGISRVRRAGPGSVQLVYGGDAAALLQRAVDERWGLSEFTPCQQTLEQVFIDLMARDTNAREGAA